MRIFCELHSIFSIPKGARKNTSNEQSVRSYDMLNHRIRGLLFHYKKNCYFANGFYFYFWVRVFTEHPDSVCKNDVNSEQNVRLYSMPNEYEWEVNYFTAKEKCYLGFYFQVRVSKISSADSLNHSCSFCICRYSPCCKLVQPGHYSVLGSSILRVFLTLCAKVTEEWNNKCK